MDANDIFGPNSKTEKGFKARSKTRYSSGNGSLLGNSMNGSTMRIRNANKKEGRRAPARIRRRFEDAHASPEKPENPPVIAQPHNEVENEDPEEDESIHIPVPRRRKVDMSKSKSVLAKSVLARSKLESTPASSRQRAVFAALLDDAAIEKTTMLGGRMETPKDNSFEADKITRVTEPVPLSLGEAVENESFALFGASDESSVAEKSAEDLVPETPYKAKDKGKESKGRKSSPLKEIQQNISINKHPSSSPEALAQVASPQKPSSSCEANEEPLPSSSPGPIPLHSYASPTKEASPSQDLPSASHKYKDLFKSLDESSFYFHVQNTPLKSTTNETAVVEAPVYETIPSVEDIQQEIAPSSCVSTKYSENKSVAAPKLPLPVVSQDKPIVVELQNNETSVRSSTKRKSEESPTVVPKLQKLDKSRLTINKRTSNRPVRAVRRMIDDPPTIRLSQSPDKPKEVKAKPTGTKMRRRRKTSIGETPDLRKNLPLVPRGRRFSRDIPDPADSFIQNPIRRQTRQSVRLQEGEKTRKPLAVRSRSKDAPVEVVAKAAHRKSIRPRSKVQSSPEREPVEVEARPVQIRPRVRTKVPSIESKERTEPTANAARRKSTRPRSKQISSEKESSSISVAKPAKRKTSTKVPEVSARRRTRLSVAQESSKPVVPIRRRELESQPTSSKKVERAIEVPALPAMFKVPKKKHESKKPRSKNFDSGLDMIGIGNDFQIPSAPKPVVAPGRLGKTMGLDNRSIFDVTGAFSRNHLSTSMLTKAMSRRIFEDDDNYVPSEEVKRALSVLKQDSPLTISSHLTSLKIKNIVKIGEGVFGEVYMGDVGNKKMILKVIPVDGTTHINSSPQKPIREVLGEFLIASALETANLPGFCRVKNATVCKGMYAKGLRTAWDKYHEEKESENDRPWEVLKDKSQLYMILSMDNCGTDLDSAKLSAKDAVSILRDISVSISKAEEAIEFEHRDLHTGNILVQEINGKMVPTVIDFTLSRAKHPVHGPVFADLELDHEIFEGSGDPQFDVYRDMQVESQKDWSKFCPTTNVLWLKFLAGWLGRNIKPCKTAQRLTRFASSSSLPHSSEEFLTTFTKKFSSLL